MISTRKFNVNLFLTIFLLLAVTWSTQDGSITVPNVKLRFPPGATMGIFVALAFPIDLPGRSVYYSHFFEAIHNLPSSEDSSFEYPPLVGRDMDREMVYKAFERKLQSNGYPGKACLLRSICEITQYSIREVNGLLGELIHIIFTPSTTENFELPVDYTMAEKSGRSHGCSSYSQNCSISFVDLISWIEESEE